jgi:guanylate cyclase
MQSSGEIGRIHISGYTAKKLKKLGFRVTYRGRVSVKGKGQMDTFWLEGGITKTDMKEKSKKK